MNRDYNLLDVARTLSNFKIALKPRYEAALMFHINRFRLVALVALSALFLLPHSLKKVVADEPSEKRPLICAYFIPADCEPVPDRAERLFRVMTCIQNFYRDEMKRNGFGSTTFELELEKSGVLKLHEVKAPLAQSEYGRESYWEVRKLVVEALKKEGIDPDREVVAIFQLGLRWEGEKAIEVSSFVGWGTPFVGTGWYYDDPALDPDKLASKEPGGYYCAPCSIGEFNSHYLGGIAHELGHAFTLPHDCELDAERETLGTSLMGSGNHVFGNEKRDEGKGAFLTRADALRLSVHSLFSGKEPRETPNDAVKLTTLEGARLSDSVVRFSGKVETTIPVRGLIFYVDPDAREADYDAKTWTTEIDENGKFQIELTEATEEPSELRIWAVCDGDSKLLESRPLNETLQQKD